MTTTPLVVLLDAATSQALGLPSWEPSFVHGSSERQYRSVVYLADDGGRALRLLPQDPFPAAVEPAGLLRMWREHLGRDPLMRVEAPPGEATPAAPTRMAALVDGRQVPAWALHADGVWVGLVLHPEVCVVVMAKGLNAGELGLVRAPERGPAREQPV